MLYFLRLLASFGISFGFGLRLVNNGQLKLQLLLLGSKLLLMRLDGGDERGVDLIDDRLVMGGASGYGCCSGYHSTRYGERIDGVSMAVGLGLRGRRKGVHGDCE